MYTRVFVPQHCTHGRTRTPTHISQIRDDYRTEYDDQRGGVGGGTLRHMERQGIDTRSLRLSIGGEDDLARTWHDDESALLIQYIQEAKCTSLYSAFTVHDFR